MKTARRNGGFSLVEVMIAVLVLGVALVGLTQGLTAALRSSKECDLQTKAALLAAAQMEILRADGFYTEGSTEGDCEAEGLTNYRWRQTLTRTSLDGLYDVTVVIENANTSQDIYELRTLVFEPPASPTLTTPGKEKEKELNRKERARTRR